MHQHHLTSRLVLPGVVFAILLAAWLAPASARAAVGELSVDACIGYPTDDACGIAPIVGPRSVAVSPDGTSVYVAVANDAVAFFSRGGPEGQLTYQDCVANTAVDGCVDLPGTPIHDPGGVAVSPDGASVNVASRGSDSITHFSRAVDGKLAYVGCISRLPIGCTQTTYNSLSGASGVAVSPDGGSAYVTATYIDSVAHLFRNGTSGGLAFDGCLGSAGLYGCGDLPGTPLDEPGDIVVSPDSKSVYVASPSSNSVARFLRSGQQGQIYFGGCWASRGEGGCTDLPGAPLDGAGGVVASPDGKSVYVASLSSDSVSHFVRDGQEGQLTYDGCLASDDAPGCSDLPGTPLNGPLGVALSPDGKSLYVAGLNSDSIAHFRRDDGNGRLTYAGCIARVNDDGQRCAESRGRALDGPRDIAVSPDGRSLYVAAAQGHAVGHFFRSLVDDPTPVPPDAPVEPSTPVGPGLPGTPGAVTCGGKRATIVGTAGRDTLGGTGRADVIAALGGNDRVSALGGNDVVCGGAGRDWLAGGRGRDRLAGGPQRDTCIGGAARDRARTCEIRRSL